MVLWIRNTLFGNKGNLFFVKYKKVGWNNQPTKCPLLKPVRFSAYQMSITPNYISIGRLTTTENPRSNGFNSTDRTLHRH